MYSSASCTSGIIVSETKKGWLLRWKRTRRARPGIQQEIGQRQIEQQFQAGVVGHEIDLLHAGLPARPDPRPVVDQQPVGVPTPLQAGIGGLRHGLEAQVGPVAPEGKEQQIAEAPFPVCRQPAEGRDEALQRVIQFAQLLGMIRIDPLPIARSEVVHGVQEPAIEVGFREEPRNLVPGAAGVGRSRLPAIQRSRAMLVMGRPLTARRLSPGAGPAHPPGSRPGSRCLP